ncbi:hypothetical protein MRB53_036972 [Persea americana]|nr:hypothetical protein MRB53_036972 [Persea americana]
MGTLVASAIPVDDEDEGMSGGSAGGRSSGRGEASEDEESFLFIFPDLSCRSQGDYRLRFTLMMLPRDAQPGTGTVTGEGDGVVPVTATLDSDAFTVFSAKDFPGMKASTPLTVMLRDQGVSVQLKKGKPGRDSGGGGGGSGSGVGTKRRRGEDVGRCSDDIAAPIVPRDPPPPSRSLPGFPFTPRRLEPLSTTRMTRRPQVEATSSFICNGHSQRVEDERVIALSCSDHRVSGHRCGSAMERSEITESLALRVTNRDGKGGIIDAKACSVIHGGVPCPGPDLTICKALSSPSTATISIYEGLRAAIIDCRLWMVDSRLLTARTSRIEMTSSRITISADLAQPVAGGRLVSSLSPAPQSHLPFITISNDLYPSLSFSIHLQYPLTTLDDLAELTPSSQWQAAGVSTSAVGVVGAGAAYYLYSAGGDAKVAEKKFEADAHKLSSKIKSEVPGRADEAKSNIKLGAQEAGSKIDSAYASAKAEGKKLEGSASAYADEAKAKLEAAKDKTGASLKAGVDKFDKTVEDGAAKAKSGISSWFGSKYELRPCYFVHAGLAAVFCLLSFLPLCFTSDRSLASALTTEPMSKARAGRRGKVSYIHHHSQPSTHRQRYGFEQLRQSSR